MVLVVLFVLFAGNITVFLVAIASISNGSGSNIIFLVLVVLFVIVAENRAVFFVCLRVVFLLAIAPISNGRNAIFLELELAMRLAGKVLTVNGCKLGYEDAGIFLQNLNATCSSIFKRVLQSFIVIECVLMKLELAMCD